MAGKRTPRVGDRDRALPPSPTKQPIPTTPIHDPRSCASCTGERSRFAGPNREPKPCPICEATGHSAIFHSSYRQEQA